MRKKEGEKEWTAGRLRKKRKAPEAGSGRAAEWNRKPGERGEGRKPRKGNFRLLLQEKIDRKGQSGGRRKEEKSSLTPAEKRADFARLHGMDFLYAAGIAGLSAMIAWLFYDSVYGMIVIVFCFPLFTPVYREKRRQKQKRELEQQFQDGLGFAAGALEAGYSAENAWQEAEREVSRLYGENAVFAVTLRRMNRRVGMNEPLENQMLDFAEKTDSENIRNFAEVFYFARKSGGNLTEIMRRTADRLRQNFQVQEEIWLAMSSKQMEQRIMCIMPLGILLYLRFGSSEFLDPLYHNSAGVLIMTAFLALYAAAWRLGEFITGIEV